MLIRPFSKNDIENTLNDVGIKECSRYIYIFVDKQEYLNGSANYGRAIIINESISDGRFTMTKLRIPNSANIRISTYFFDVTFNSFNVKNLNTTQLTLTESFGTERTISYNDNKVIDYETSQYGSLYLNLNDTTQDWIQTKDWVFLPPPKYYNETHMYYQERDFNSLFDFNELQIYILDELIDEFTTVKIFNKDFWDTMNTEIIEYMDKLYAKNEYNVGEVSKQLYTQFIQASIEDSIFIYDSDLGINIKGGKVPYQKYQIKDYLIKDIKNTKTIFELTCKEIEEKYGNIRVHMQPNIYGDSFNILCKDYDIKHQPFNIINKSNNIITLDRSYPTNLLIGDVIETISKIQ